MNLTDKQNIYKFIYKIKTDNYHKSYNVCMVYADIICCFLRLKYYIYFEFPISNNQFNLIIYEKRYPCGQSMGIPMFRISCTGLSDNLRIFFNVFCCKASLQLDYRHFMFCHP